ncbi:response regulator [Cereibacter azotoformans]|uniref:Response regulator receiver domain-containing protein n=1 Tax=Cereibacter azotoformans TaxID=43057 RepID=A0A2T5K907_9RHOB|nr:response regulator [Cereibacter azotoformans]AXQ93356.1 response regulator [Cereibacter sphaeroides]MBO4168975.1 response regulator [Cereibacter azotoformans]PTR18906.1 response regulator receiver domain-containing protein [Cereibacter azotoformans]UIJ31676.1 response regulator [Cereibacter azotoformans]
MPLADKLHPPRILLAEDDLVLAMTMVDELRASGFEIVGPTRSAAEGARLVEHQSVDAALLDLRLKDGPCFGLARALRIRGIPFAFVTGETREAIPEDLADVDVLDKPVTAVTISTMLEKLLQEP